MKKKIAIFITVVAALGASALYAGSGACTKCKCKQWEQKSPHHGKAGEPHAYCKCGHFWSSHR